MDNTFTSIAKSLRTLGIIGPIVFTGSAALKAFKLLDREIADIDILLIKNNKNTEIISALEKLFGLDKSKSSNNHTVLYYQNIHLDIALKDSNEMIEYYEVEQRDYGITTPKHIITTKIGYNRKKDREDIQNIELNAIDKLIYLIGTSDI